MAKTITLQSIEPLDAKKHDRAGFTCGVESLDVFLREKARKKSPELSLTFVLTCTEEPAEILGHYSLSATNLRADDLPEVLKKRLGQYGAVPATLLGRLATAKKHQGNKDLRVGECLLIDAMLKTYKASRSVASFGLIVDVVKSERSDPTGFYKRYGFIECTETPNKMYLPMKTIEDIRRRAGLIT